MFLKKKSISKFISTQASDYNMDYLVKVPLKTNNIDKQSFTTLVNMDKIFVTFGNLYFNIKYDCDQEYEEIFS